MRFLGWCAAGAALWYAPAVATPVGIIKSSPLFSPTTTVVSTSSNTGLPQPGGTQMQRITSGPWTIYKLPNDISNACALDPNFAGSIWVQDFRTNKLVELNLHANTTHEYDIPYKVPMLPAGIPALNKHTPLACSMKQGKDGLLYFANGLHNQVGTINGTTKKIQMYTQKFQKTKGQSVWTFNEIAPGSEGMFFTMSEVRKVGLLDYKTHQFRYVAAAPAPALKGQPLGLVEGPDTQIWGTDFTSNALFAVNQTTLKLQEFSIPLSLRKKLDSPGVMRVVTQNRYLWFCAFGSSSLGRFDTHTHQFTAYPAPMPLAFPTENDIDGDGNIWFSSGNLDSFYRFNTTSTKFTEYTLPDKLKPIDAKTDPPFPAALRYNKEDNKLYFTIAAGADNVKNQITGSLLGSLQL